MCHVAIDFDHQIKAKDPLTDEERSYELPDEKGIIQVDHQKRYLATEILF